MKKYLVYRVTYTSASACCPTCGVELDWLFGKPLSVRNVLYVALTMIGTVVAARG